MGELSRDASPIAKNPEIGTWKLNLEKSKYNPEPPPKSPTVITMEASGNGVKYSSKGINAEGKETAVQYTANYDGKDMPLTGSQLANTVSLKKIDANTVERVDKKDGKPVSTIRRAYSKDGKSMTATVNGMNVKGEKTNNTLVYDKM